MAWKKKDPRMMRVALLRAGRTVEERTVAAGEVRLPGASRPVLVRRNGGWALRLDAACSGRLARGSGAVPLEALRVGPPDASGEWEIPLEEDARGKLVVGDVTLLFQRVAPAASGRAPSFRPAVVSRDDAVFVESLGFFAALGGMFVAWVLSVEPRPVTVEDLDRADLVEHVGYVPMPKLEPLVAPPPAGGAPVDGAPIEGAPKPVAAKPGPAPRLRPEDSPLLKIGFPVTRGDGEGSARPFAEEAQIDAAFGPAVAARPSAEAGPRRVSRAGEAEDIESIERIGAGTASIEEVEVAVTLEPPRLEPDLPQADAAAVRRVVERERGELRYCYERELRTHPEVSGRIDVDWVVRKGRVTAVEVTGNTTGSDALAACITARVERWAFPPELETEVGWPFLFRPLP